MHKATFSLALCIAGALLAFPPLVGLVDLWSWLVLGEQVSWVEWTDGRAGLALSMTIGSLLCFLGPIFLHEI